MYRVMIRDNMSPVAKEILEATGRIEVVVDNDKTTGQPDHLAGIIDSYDALAIRSGTRVDETVLKATNRLKVVGRAGIGVDNVDVAAATRHGVVVMNAPGGNTVTTAEHTISMMMALARNIPQATASMRAGRWEKKQLVGTELTDKTLGIVGLGQIGRIVAQRALGLKMKVIAADPYVSKAAAEKIGVQLVVLDELLATADFISLHVPKLKDTVNFINAETLAKMRPGVRLINCCRGEVINLEDLYQALESGRVAGAALDVLPQEPPNPQWPILQHPRVILTPHLGASTGEAQDKVAQMIARQIAAYLLDDVIINAVNFPSLPAEQMDQLRPYLSLAENMGSLIGQLETNLHDLTLTYSGDMADMQTRPLTHAMLKGLLEAATDTPVNYVSAPALAKDKGIQVKEILNPDLRNDFAGAIRLKVNDEGAEIDETWGTLFSGVYPRIVRLGKIYMDAIPEGDMIVIQNMDRPGVIGNVGTTLGQHNINIGRFQLGRLKGQAVCLVNIDEPADEKVMQALTALPNILSVRQVHLTK